jgi:tRNA 5-methylaminomethyl-2-thiouridine biosynthesis bifunctional protein
LVAYITFSWFHMQYANLIWRDGQPYSEQFDDIYYSSDEGELISGESEFSHVFFKHNGLPERWKDADQFVIAELGFGSGLNCLLTIREWLKHLEGGDVEKCLHYIAIEKYPLSPDSIVQLISKYSELKQYCDELVSVYPPAVSGSHSRHLFDNRVVIHYKFMDAYDALKNDNFKIDAWYLDGFSPANNVEMWSENLFEMIAQNSRRGTTCSTYTAAGYVKRNLQKANFSVKKVSGHGKKREMLTARFDGGETTDRKYGDKPWFDLPVPHKVQIKKATVIGAGIAGLSVAYSLVKRGWTVTVIDKHSDVAQETSANPAAIIYPRLSVNNDIDVEFYLAAYCYTLYVLQLLQSKAKEKFWFDDGLIQTIDEQRYTDLLEKFSFNDDFFTREDVVPFLNQKCEASNKVCVKYPFAGVVLPELLCNAIVHECGDKLQFTHAEIDEIKFLKGRWQCLTGDALINESDVLVIASGVDVNGFGLDLNLPVEQVRGQVVVLEKNLESSKMTTSINSDVYITPAINNKHYLGATYSRDNRDVAVDKDDVEFLFKSLGEVHSGLFNDDSISDYWVGFRAMSNDRVAIVGGLPDQSFFKSEYADINHGRKNKSYRAASHLTGLYISTAHGSRGFTNSFLCAEIIAAQIAGEPMPVSEPVLDYLNPSRFIINNLKRS